MTVLDASAALAYLQGERGAEIVERHLGSAVIGAANLAEVLGRMSGPAEAGLAESLLVAQGVSVEPVTRDDARLAARMRADRAGLSLGDRLCLALASRRGEDALTADPAWGTGPGIVQIRG